ncbi:transmembrane amino acid transporter [Rickenella mellea]|uniref:Transmembrane amino acid transporter n=1 Tax=Rickenella mellea TaxID=50990 RepID=A0A4Y7Q6P1_9AGAM|nr:transmembrane amino acid transporter [Rickenella mellea]
MSVEDLKAERESDKELVALDYNDIDRDVFGNEDGHDIRYKTLSWQLVAVLMIAEIVSNGMLSLPQSLAIVGIVPGLILIIFLGAFATFTSYLLIQFKLNHPEVHNMGDAGYILLGPVGREVLGLGTIIFAICGVGSVTLTGQLALASLSDSKLCLMLYAGIFAIPILLLSFPRTLDRLSWLSIPSVISILVAGLVGMIGSGVNPVPGRTLSATVSTDFFDAFVAITNPVFAYAGHFMFFILISEMKRPQDAMKAAYVLQGFATTFYAVFAIVVYAYIGETVASPSFSSLPPKWQKAAYAIAIPNFIIAGSLYAHTAAKVLFIRLFRNSEHLHSHTLIGWATWTGLIVIVNACSFILSIAVPIFSLLIGVAATLFASWYTYGIAGAFWLHDAWHIGGWKRLKERWIWTALSILTFLAGAFICVAGTYVICKLIVDAYASGSVGHPFSC